MKLFTVDFRDLHSVCAYVYDRERERGVGQIGFCFRMNGCG